MSEPSKPRTKDDLERDKVDQAVENSMDASDPPSSNPGSAGRPDAKPKEKKDDGKGIKKPAVDVRS
ncbi:hypothetical protein [Marinivivus vitaminiproducens]|uniref:hypothetical protein n=1 Tax=Marinivivus vitaminiproducens TaxID=3035935 RepID=UPI00279F57CD|nr:hypothetical protein P4R82_16285 [Geminicoccaceae bacterium SCSIO 64248]